MKICAYCESENDDSAKVCSACGASGFKNKCNNCGTVFESAFCPSCGTKAGTQAKICPHCGERYFTPACPRCGYSATSMREERKTVEQSEHVVRSNENQNSANPTRQAEQPTVVQYVEKPKKKVTLGKILLWIFFLPIMAIVAVWQSKKLATKWKILLTVIIAAMTLLYYYGNNSTETKQTTAAQSSVSRSATKTQTAVPAAQASKATAEATATPQKQARNGFREGTTKYTVQSISVSVPNYFGDPTEATSGTELSFTKSAEKDIALIIGFTQSNATEKEFEKKADQAFLNLLENAKLIDSKETAVAGLPGRRIEATGYYSNVHVQVSGVIALDEEQKGLFVIILFQGDNVQYDYSSDFNKIVTRVSRKTKPTQSSSGTVSQSLKEVLDGYEAFVDSYCAFLKKYGESNDTSALALEYLNMLAKYSEWVSKIDDIDKDSLSEADLKYYTEVTLRISNKLLQAYTYLK